MILFCMYFFCYISLSGYIPFKNAYFIKYMSGIVIWLVNFFNSKTMGEMLFFLLDLFGHHFYNSFCSSLTASGVENSLGIWLDEIVIIT